MDANNDLATLVIQHHVFPASKDRYEEWVKKIAREGQRFTGHLGVNVIRPHGTTHAYTIVLRFDSHEHLKAWVDSDARKQLVEEAQPFLTSLEELEIRTGLEYWFTPPEALRVHANPFQQFLVTLSAIFPLTVVVPWALQPIFAQVPLLAHPLIAKFIGAIVIVWLMVYLIMPRYTRAIAGWLFR